MLPKMLLSALVSMFDVILGTVEALPLPDSLTEYIGIGVRYIVSGMAFVAQYIDVSYILSLVVVVAAVDSALFLYRLGLWIVRKIPFLGVR